ncbi:hypothetical protein GTQ40_11365 [Flavobacteriaceae bacterium R38]|nr:hypothetical protein [Flavobacteriaceae bacterium R38]
MMNEFNEILEIWENQPNQNASKAGEVIKEAKRIKERIKRNHFWTKLILTITVMILITFFISVSVHNFNQSFTGAFIMVSVLLIRIFLEYLSWNKYRKLDDTRSLNMYTKQASSFYKWRKKIHILCTPLIFLLYVFGFILLMPFFKNGLSEGFYTYVKVSSIVIFIVLSVFILKQVKKELETLKFLEELFKDD